MLDLLEDSATGRGTVHFPAEEQDPTPIGELWDASERAARWMAAKVGTGATVAAVLTNTRSCVTALFGAWRAGCTVASLPLPARGMSPQVYADQLTRFAAAAGAQTLMVDPAHASMVEGATLRFTPSKRRGRAVRRSRSARTAGWCSSRRAASGRRRASS